MLVVIFVCLCAPVTGASALRRSKQSCRKNLNRVPISACKWARGLPSNICVQWKVNGPPVYTFLTISHDVTMNPLWTDLCQKTFRSLPLLRFSFSTFPYCTHQAASLQSEFFWWNHIFSFFFPFMPPSNFLSLSLSFSDPGAFCPWLSHSKSNWISTSEATAKSTRMFWLRRTLFNSKPFVTALRERKQGRKIYSSYG